LTLHIYLILGMHLTFLGTGTSTGVPQLLCRCPVCTSADPRDRRFRTSALVEVQGKSLLIDCGPDFREQMRRYYRKKLDALLVTHHHYDHVGGTDDLRPYCTGIGSFPVYCQQEVADDFVRRMPYSFSPHPYPGAPHFSLNVIKPYEHFQAAGVDILPVKVSHFMLDIVGFVIGQLAYITDAKHLPEQTLQAITGVDTLVINALRIEHEHNSHFTLSEALEVIEAVHPRRAFLTHFSHEIGLTSHLVGKLPSNVYPAHDGLCIEIPD